MSASIIYLITLLGIAFGLAFGGLVGGVFGGMSFFLLHRIFTLSKRIDALEKRLNDAIDDSHSPTEESKAVPEPPAPAIAVPMPTVQVEAAPTSPQTTDADALKSLNTTLQALLPALAALRSPLPNEATTAAPPGKPAMSADACPETYTAAREEAVRTVPLPAQHNSQPSQAAISNEPHLATHPAVQQSPSTTLTQIEEKTVPTPVAEDLNVLRDELSQLMNDITIERARFDAQSTAISAAPPAHEADLAAKTLQELLIEVRRITANTLQRPNQS